MHLLTHSQLIFFKNPKLNTASFEDRKNWRKKWHGNYSQGAYSHWNANTNIKGAFIVFARALSVTSTSRTTLLSPPFYG